MERRIEILKEAGLFMGQLAMRMKRDAIYQIMGEELPLQDYLSFNLVEHEMHEDDPVSCLKFATKVLEALNKANEHIVKGEKMGLETDERQLADILFGVAPNNYPQDYVALGKEASAIVKRNMRGIKPQMLTKEQRIKLATNIVREIEKEANSRGITFKRQNGMCYELMMVGEWLENKLY